jgi:hypothetical protein
MCDYFYDFDGEFMDDDFIDDNMDGNSDEYEIEEVKNDDSMIDKISIADAFITGGIGGLIYEDISEDRQRRNRRIEYESGDF